MTDVAYGVVLLFDDALAAAITGYAAALGAGAGRRMVLGPDAPPHVTLAHATCDRDVALAWWSRCRGMLPDAVPVRFHGVSLAPVPAGDYYVPEGGVYAGLEALPDPELHRWHRAVVRHARDLGAGLLGAVGDAFRPHVTLGVLTGGPVLVTPPDPAMLSPATGLRPVLGRLGPYGTFPEILT